MEPSLKEMGVFLQQSVNPKAKSKKQKGRKPDYERIYTQ